jgi:hypothetical protein
MVLMILGELYLPLFLGEMKKILVTTKKRKGIRELLEQKKNIVVPNMIVLRR